ncbi:hypothetical protein [Ammoniphilus sp. YIM 78166]|uniref:hypothetical protein n=1 Tax=Ammoniphilus sp. YIM 78166 TaxID=1644106 RepID=UPI00106FDA9E|nr:hypothetical protein [Ammoniphilus sp. YIM 78166]
MRNQKNPWVVTMLSILYPGLGHAYMGDMAKGVLYVIIHSLLLFLGLITLGFLGLPAIIFWIVIIIKSIVTAFEKNTAVGHSSEHVHAQRNSLSFWITLVLAIFFFYTFPFLTYFNIYDRLPSEKREVQAYMEQSLATKYGSNAHMEEIEYSWDASNMDGRFEGTATLAAYPMIPFRVAVSGDKPKSSQVEDTFLADFVNHKYKQWMDQYFEQHGFVQFRFWAEPRLQQVRLDATKLPEQLQQYVKISVSGFFLMDIHEGNKQELADQIWSLLKLLNEKGMPSVSLEIGIVSTNWIEKKQDYLSDKKIAQIDIPNSRAIQSAEEILSFIMYK